MVHKHKLNWDSTLRATDFDMIDVKIAASGNSGLSDEAGKSIIHNLLDAKSQKPNGKGKLAADIA